MSGVPDLLGKQFDRELVTVLVARIMTTLLGRKRLQIHSKNYILE